MNALLLYLAFPVIFLTVASVIPGKVTLLKAVCISLAYLSLMLLNGLVCDSSPTLASAGSNALDGKDNFPFGLVFLAVSAWAFIVVCRGDERSQEDNLQ